MNTSRKQILPVHFVASPSFTVSIAPGDIRRHGVAPLLIKSLRAQMAAARSPRTHADT